MKIRTTHKKIEKLYTESGTLLIPQIVREWIAKVAPDFNSTPAGLLSSMIAVALATVDMEDELITVDKDTTLPNFLTVLREVVSDESEDRDSDPHANGC